MYSQHLPLKYHLFIYILVRSIFYRRLWRTLIQQQCDSVHLELLPLGGIPSDLDCSCTFVSWHKVFGSSTNLRFPWSTLLLAATAPSLSSCADAAVCGAILWDESGEPTWPEQSSPAAPSKERSWVWLTGWSHEWLCQKSWADAMLYGAAGGMKPFSAYCLTLYSY